MTDRNSVEELKHGQSGFSDSQLAPYLGEAMDSLIDDLFSGKKVGYFHLDAYVEKFAEEIAAWLISPDWGFGLRALLEPLIRRELTDSDELRERAVELANTPPEE